jgi:hypothetical protein
MSNILIAFILASILTTVIAVTTMFLVDTLFGQPLYKKLRKKYNELFIHHKQQ